MLNEAIKGLLARLAMAIILFTAFDSTVMADVQRMSVNDLNSKLEAANILILDARRKSDWNDAEYKIKGALRYDEKEAREALKSARSVVVYCA